MPAAPDDLTITQLDGDTALAELEWTHDGIDLDRFEVLYKGPDDDVWTSETLAPEADFGAGPYTAEVPSGEDFEWAVRALEVDGTVSTLNPKATFSHRPDGLWLLPRKRNGKIDRDARVWIGANWPAFLRDRPESVSDIPSRSEFVVQTGKLKLREGAIEEGLLLDRHGRTAEGWKRKLYLLARHQHRYQKIILAGSRGRVHVQLGAINEAAVQAGGPAWKMRVALREVK